MIKYLGSKRVLIPTILAVFDSLPEVRSVVDLFSGTARVGHALKRAGYRVKSNDYLAYAQALAMCYVQADRAELKDAATQLIDEFNRIPGRPGYVTHTFCEQSRFFQPKNGARIDAIRAEIARKSLAPELEAICLVALMEAADRVDSTTGVQMAYLKQWAARSHNDLCLRVPDLVDRPKAGKCEAHSFEAAHAVDVLEADAIYLDPPYNQHSYLGNYHIWETLARMDEPECYGVACKRVDCRERKSEFNFKKRAFPHFKQVIERARADYLIVSFNNEGFVPRKEMEEALSSRGKVFVIEKDHKRYVGAQIGIYNPLGDKVGQVSHVRNKEYIYVVVPNESDWTPACLDLAQKSLAADL